MSKQPAPRAIALAVAHSEPLAFAQKALEPEQFLRLFLSYRQLFRFILFYLVASPLLILLLCVLFVDDLEFIATLCMNGFVLGLILWVILSRFVAGKLWHRYSIWYRSGLCMEELPQIFK